MRRFGPAAVVVVVGLGATLLAGWLQYVAHRSEAREAFSAWCEERQQQLTRIIDGHIEVLYGLRAFFDGSEDVALSEFQNYAKQAIARRPHLRSLGFLRPVSDVDRAQFEADYSARLGRRFQIVNVEPEGQLMPAQRRPEYLALVYAYPDGGPPTGVDALRNEQTQRVVAAMRQNNSASALIVPRRDDGPIERVVHVYLPVYAHPGMQGLYSQDKSGVHDNIYGYVRVRFVVEDLLETLSADARAAGVETAITVPTDTTIVPDSEGTVTVDPSGRSGFIWKGSIPVADRNLLLQLRTTAAYVQRPHFLASWPLLLIGFVLTTLGTVSTFLLTRNRLQLQRLAERLTFQIRERQLSEDRMTQSEERYRVLIENSPDATLLFRKGRVVFINPAGVQLFAAASERELLGRGALDLVHPDFRPEAQKRLDRMAADRSPLPPIEERLLRLDGTVVDVEVRSVPYIADGEMMLLVVIRDITARRKAERERTSLEAALRQSQRLEAMGTFTGGIAHDFNNILSSIVGNIQLVLDDLPRPHPARQSAHEIRNATNRARDLVKRLMAFSKEQEAPLSAVELPPLIEEVRQLLRPTMPAGVVLNSRVPAGTPAVMANATQLHQVLVNLCTNAWQAMPAAQGQIDIVVTTLSADDARIESRAQLQGSKSYVCIEVRDNGSGMEPQIVDRIFEPFFTTKRAGEGSGLGLAVVHGIVSGHKGAIRTVSRLGEGTSFYLYLPASESAGLAPVTEPQQPPRGRNQHVLYVDDEEPLVFLVTRVLERHGYRCTGTTDPQQAVDVVRTDPHAFDLIITDMNMPGMSGIDVARQVLAIRADLPVLITTGYVRASDVATISELGVRDLILKPDTIEELAAVVARYLQPPAPAG